MSSTLRWSSICMQKQRSKLTAVKRGKGRKKKKKKTQNWRRSLRCRLIHVAPWFGKWAHIPLDNRVSASGTSDDTVLYCSALIGDYRHSFIQSLLRRRKKRIFRSLMDPWKSSMAILSFAPSRISSYVTNSFFFFFHHKEKEGTLTISFSSFSFHWIV